MKSVLTKAGYQYDQAKRIWQRAECEETHGGFSDDGTEERLSREIEAASNGAVAPSDLILRFGDLPEHHPLNPLQANILRPLAGMLKCRILEIGAGSGVVTRFLGEIGGEIVSIEPDRKWAGVAATRCRDLANVHILAEELNDVRLEPIFDVVILLGLVDLTSQVATGPIVTGANEAAKEHLSRALRFMRPGGILITAVNNRLGLGCLASTEERAVPTPGEGFGRLSLRYLLEQVGLPFQGWMFPFPNYKSARTVVAEEAFSHPALWAPGVLSAFNGRERSDGFAPARRLAFDESWCEAINNQLGADLAESFLVLASQESFVMPAGEILASDFVVDRRPAYARERLFSIGEDGGLRIDNHELFPELKSDPHHPIESIPRVETIAIGGRVWAEELTAILSTPEWTHEQVTRWTRRWYRTVQAQAGIGLADSSQLLPGRMLEALPHKMLVSPGEESSFFDQDLSLRYPLESGFLLFRGLTRALLGAVPVAPPATGTTLHLLTIVQETARALGVTLTDQDLVRYCQFECEIESWVSGRSAGNLEALAEYSLECLPVESSELSAQGQLEAAVEAVHRLRTENNELYTRLCETQAHVKRLQNDQASLWEWAVQINTNPIRYALKKRGYNLARDTIRALPVPVALKRRLRDLYFVFIRPLLHRSEERKMASDLKSTGKEQIQQLVAPGTGRDILIFSVIDWRFRVQRPQHIARSLAGNGRRVFYFSKHFINAREPGYQIEPITGADGLYRVMLCVKGSPSIYYEPPTGPELEMLGESLARLRADLGVQTSAALIQHPYWYPLLRQIPETFRVYDCMDHHEGFGDVSDQLVAVEKEMLKEVELVTVTSQWLADLASSLNPNVAMIRNAVDYDHFASRPERVYADAAGRRIIGYYGAIAEWFDVELVRAVAMAFPDHLLLMVGEDSVGASKRLADLANVRFIGEVPYATLPYYLYAFDVCLLPFRVIPLTLATNPVKVYEYLAAGKPVVCVDLPETLQFGDLVVRAATHNDFVAGIKRSLDEAWSATGIDIAQRRRLFASEQTWRHRGESLLNRLPAEFKLKREGARDVTTPGKR